MPSRISVHMMLVRLPKQAKTHHKAKEDPRIHAVHFILKWDRGAWGQHHWLMPMLIILGIMALKWLQPTSQRVQAWTRSLTSMFKSNSLIKIIKSITSRHRVILLKEWEVQAMLNTSHLLAISNMPRPSSELPYSILRQVQSNRALSHTRGQHKWIHHIWSRAREPQLLKWDEPLRFLVKQSGSWILSNFKV